MAEPITQPCPRCGVPIQRRRPRTALHATLTVLTVGAWGVVWAILALRASTGTCRRCAVAPLPAQALHVALPAQPTQTARLGWKGKLVVALAFALVASHAAKKAGCEFDTHDGSEHGDDSLSPASAERLANALNQSDGISCHAQAFADAAALLILREPACDIDDFVQAGGFTRSPNKGRAGRAVYFIHCGTHNRDRWYVEVDASCGGSSYRLFQ